MLVMAILSVDHGTLFVVKNVKICAGIGLYRIFASKIVTKIEDFSV